MFRSSDWADRCVYQCRICHPPVVFDTHSKMSYHVKKRHNMAMKDYTAQFGRAMIHEEKHCCQICNSHVLWERSSIYQHIYQRRSILAVPSIRCGSGAKHMPQEPSDHRAAVRVLCRELDICLRGKCR